MRLALENQLRDQTYVVYVSPLRALSNDIQRNLQGPLAEILQLARAEQPECPEVRAMVRTGDTPAKDRQQMVRRPPHILVTTPESLYLLLTGPKSRETLRNVETVIVDEIHSVARDKRGSHLMLSLERLDALCGSRPVRIGLSATQKPIDELAKFLSGSSAPAAAVVNVGHFRDMDLNVEVPGRRLQAVCSHEHWDEVYQRLVQLIDEHRTTLMAANRAASQGGRPEGGGGDRFAGAGHRHRTYRPCLPARNTAIDRHVLTANRAGRPLARSGAQGQAFRAEP
jgi:ATP-dependent Lhr-like helicase